MIDFTNGDRRFLYRAVGVAIEDGCVLLNRMDDADFWVLPGGRVEFGETSVDALKREMEEELGRTVQVGRLLWVAESFLMDAGLRVHGIGLYHAMKLPGNSANHEPFEVMDGQFRLLLAWHPLTDLAALTVYPPFLREGLVSLPEHPTHVLDIRTETGS
ncbi:MAG: NUDIX hydrolase [Ktedonobacterales bacterium]